MTLGILGVFRAVCPRRKCGWASYAVNRAFAMEALAAHIRNEHPHLEGPFREDT